MYNIQQVQALTGSTVSSVFTLTAPATDAAISSPGSTGNLTFQFSLDGTSWTNAGGGIAEPGTFYVNNRAIFNPAFRYRCSFNAAQVADVTITILTTYLI
jgi:hypothetical protein